MRTLVALLVCVAVVVIGPITGCASDPLPVASTRDVDLGDPDEVIANALTTMLWSASS